MALKQTVERIKTILLSLNHEPHSKLLGLPGIGLKTADKIIALRQSLVKEGRPMSIEDIANGVPGIGTGLFTKLTGDKNATTVIKYASLYQQLFNSGDLVKFPHTVLSLDLGIQNSAYVLMDSSYTVREWKRVELGMPSPYNPTKCFNEVKKSLEQFPAADMYVIEEQSHRNPSNKGFLSISVQLRALEAMVFSLCKLSKEVQVVTLPATRVSRYFDISGNKRAVKKKLAIECTVQMWDSVDTLESPLGSRLKVSKQHRDYFEEERKKDDLSDCLLQAVAVLDWCEMAKELS